MFLCNAIFYSISNSYYVGVSNTVGMEVDYELVVLYLFAVFIFFMGFWQQF